jgi:hypothetical protein
MLTLDARERVTMIRRSKHWQYVRPMRKRTSRKNPNANVKGIVPKRGGKIRAIRKGQRAKR